MRIDTDKILIIFKGYKTAEIGTEGPGLIVILGGSDEKGRIVDDGAEVLHDLVVDFNANTHLDASNLIVLNATLPKATAPSVPEGSERRWIPGARFMDLENVFCKPDAEFPNTMPGAREFEQGARRMGVNKKSAVVVYDEHGIYSSPRAWWMFRAMGHEQVAVLDGGLPEWLRQGLPVRETSKDNPGQGDFEARYREEFFKDTGHILNHLDDERMQVIDARSEERFRGQVAEPREGLRSGHIPNSLNMPYTGLLNAGRFRNKQELQNVFAHHDLEDKDLVFSCGSGITACVLALAAHSLGRKSLSVYDGSWSEWGSKPELPLDKS